MPEQTDVRLRTPVTRYDKLPRTGRECHECEDGEFLKDGNDLICADCQYAPQRDESVSIPTPWERHEKQVAKRDGDGRERPRMVGGYREAYHGQGEYSYDPRERSFSF